MPSPLRTTAGNLCLGSAPDSWGIWFPEDEHQVPYTRFLDELAQAGYTWVELGPYGYLPTDPQHLKEELAARGLQVSGGTAFGALHPPEAWDDMLTHARQVAELTATVGAHHLVLIPPMYRDEKTGAYTEPPELTAQQWAGFGRAADRLGKLLLDDYAVRLVIHPHADSHIQTQPEVERLLNESDSRYTNLCLDTGHVAYGGGDNLDLIRRFGERVGYVHIKQMDPEILAQVTAENLSFGEAVKLGVCVSPPAGVPNPADVVSELANLDAELFMMDTAVHEIDVLRWLLDDEIVSAQMVTPRATSKRFKHLKDPQIMYFDTANGVRIDLEVFVNCQYGYDIQCETVGENGLVRLPDPVAAGVRTAGQHRRPTGLEGPVRGRLRHRVPRVDQRHRGRYRAHRPHCLGRLRRHRHHGRTVRSLDSDGTVVIVDMKPRPAFYGGTA